MLLIEARMSKFYLSKTKSLAIAELNLKREIGERNFDQVHDKAKSAWHHELIKVKAEGGTDEQLKTF